MKAWGLAFGFLLVCTLVSPVYSATVLTDPPYTAAGGGPDDPVAAGTPELPTAPEAPAPAPAAADQPAPLPTTAARSPAVMPGADDLSGVCANFESWKKQQIEKYPSDCKDGGGKICCWKKKDANNSSFEQNFQEYAKKLSSLCSQYQGAGAGLAAGTVQDMNQVYQSVDQKDKNSCLSALGSMFGGAKKADTAMQNYSSCEGAFRAVSVQALPDLNQCIDKQYIEESYAGLAQNSSAAADKCAAKSLESGQLKGALLKNSNSLVSCVGPVALLAGLGILGKWGLDQLKKKKEQEEEEEDEPAPAAAAAPPPAAEDYKPNLDQVAGLGDEKKLADRSRLNSAENEGPKDNGKAIAGEREKYSEFAKESLDDKKSGGLANADDNKSNSKISGDNVLPTGRGGSGDQDLSKAAIGGNGAGNGGGRMGLGGFGDSSGGGGKEGVLPSDMALGGQHESYLRQSDGKLIRRPASKSKKAIASKVSIDCHKNPRHARCKVKDDIQKDFLLRQRD